MASVATQRYSPSRCTGWQSTGGVCVCADLLGDSVEHLGDVAASARATLVVLTQLRQR